jgi:hypothetical protein
MNLHTVRSGGYAGIAFILVVLVAGFAPGIPPDNSHPASEIAAYYDGHRTLFLLAAWMACVAVVLFTWYGVGFYRLLANAGIDEGLPLFSFVSGIIANVVSIVSAGLTGALVFHPSSALGPQASLALADLASMFATIIWLPVAGFAFGAARSGARHASLPSWVVWIGYVTALACIVASFSIMIDSGPLVLGGMFGFGALLIFLVFVLASSIVMIRADVSHGASAP